MPEGCGVLCIVSKIKPTGFCYLTRDSKFSKMLALPDSNGCEQGMAMVGARGGV
jgi:hypothetical protein